MMATKPELIGETLTRHYRLSCELFSTFPLPHFTHQLSQGCLDLHLDNIDLDHLEALCHAVKNKVSPSSFRIFAPTNKEVMMRVVERAVEGAGVCVVASLTLASLVLDGVRFQGRTLRLLCEGVRKARTLKTLYIRRCGLGDSGTESVCQAVKNVPSITHLSLVDCGVAERGATAIACLIKHQQLNRDSAMWQDTLRQRQPHLDGMKGLRRLTLNSNPLLGDQGVAAIAEVLTEDLWIKAMDLQHCGIGVGGGASLHALLRTNQTLEVVDVRNNPFLPEKVLGELANLLHGRQTEASAQYSLLKTSEVEEEVVEKHQRGGGETAGYRTSGRVIMSKRTQQLPRVPTSIRRPKPPSQFGVPWRVEHRLYERREGLTPGSMVKEYFGEQQQRVGAASQPSRESASEGEVNMKKIRRKLHHYKKKYQKEHERRQRLECKLSRIQTQLKGLHTLDEFTISHIEECFLKFQIFLSMMQNSGEQSKTSSSGAVSPLPHPSAEPDSIQTPPDSTIPPETFFPFQPSTGPIPVVTKQPHNVCTFFCHPDLAPHLNSMQGGDLGAEKVNESEMSNRSLDGAVNLKIHTPEINRESQDQISYGNDSEMPRKNNSNFMIMASHPYRNSFLGPAPQEQLEGKKNRDEMIMANFSIEKQEEVKNKREILINNKTNKNKQRKEEINSEGNDAVLTYVYSSSMKHRQTVGTQVNSDIIEWELGKIKKNTIDPELICPGNGDPLAMRLEFGEDFSEKVSDEWNNEKAKYASGKESHSMGGNIQLHQGLPSQDFSLKKSKKIKETHTIKEDQSHMKSNMFAERKEAVERFKLQTKIQGSGTDQILQDSQPLQASQSPQDSQLLQAGQSVQDSQSFQVDQSVKESQSLQANQLPQVSQLPHTSQLLQPIQSFQAGQSRQGSQPYSNLSPYKIKPVKESQLLQPSPSSPEQSLQLIQLYQDSQSSGSHSPSSQSLPGQSPQESHSPKRSQLLQNYPPQQPRTSQNQSPQKPDPTQESHLPQKSKSPQNQSPKKNKSHRKEELGGVQCSEVSETDDEKMRNLSVWLHGRTRGRASTPSSSSLSISEQLQQSHASWTRSQGRHMHKEEGIEISGEGEREVEESPEGKEVEEQSGESEFEFSGLEDVSLSGITLSNTSVPEEIHTPGEEDF